MPDTSAWGFGYNEIFCKNLFFGGGGDIKIKKGSCEPMKNGKRKSLSTTLGKCSKAVSVLTVNSKTTDKTNQS